MCPPQSIILAIDSSTRTVGVALYDGSQVLSETVWTSTDYHTVELAPTVAEALRHSSMKVEAIGAIAVATGPGSFTGLRIGIALAKGISLVRHIPIIGVPTLDFLAYAQPLLETQLLAVLRAGRGRLAIGRYEVHGKLWRSASQIEIITPEQLAGRIKLPAYICGEISDSERELLRMSNPLVTLATPARSVRRPGFLAEIGWKRWKSGRVDNPASLAPMYFHYNEPIPG